MPTLTWQRRDAHPLVFHLQGLETTIGREPGNTVRLDSQYVSKRHALIRLSQQGYTVADLNSSNGTLVNGQRITLAVLKDGDRIELGAEALVFSDPVAGAPAGGQATSKRSPVLLAIIGGGGVILVALVLLILLGGPAEQGGSTGTTAAPAGGAGVPAGGASPGPGWGPPPTADVPATSPAAAGVPQPLPPTGADPGLPSQDPQALYDMALSAVRGGRLLEARRLLDGSVRLDPTNASAMQRLREVDATIQATVEQSLAAGQRDFTYLRYADAILQWEQVLSLTDPSDPRHQQAAAGIQRARERMRR